MLKNTLLSSGTLSFRASTRLLLWVTLSLILSVVFFREFWVGLPGMLSPARIIGQNQVSPWGVLALSFVFLWLRRKEVRQGMQVAPCFVFVPVGVLMTIAGLLISVSSDYIVFQVLLTLLGGFIIFFGKGAKVPAILLAIYGFAITFPLLVERFSEGAYAQTVIIPLNWLLTVLGYPFVTEGPWLHLVNSKGEMISVVVTVACAGPSTMGVFLAIFALMMLDMPLKGKKAMWLLLFGIFGTWLQNLIRVMTLMVMAYYIGERAMWTAHSWTIYFLFPAWYLLFAYIYFRQFGRQRRASSPPPVVVGEKEAV